ncbi:patatin-like phospholipase family protein [Herbaspirillum sp. RTI4]|uniref:patatin-like phospholipase family protein n=1 Tax=Herbaspirillum sp. RTI4 TaxID=3048640 RepID=UPI002AB5D0DE|nr:patatin-like phospholipase family protein [Herbaspirillum sp. RTI4]MDY7578048.1 patatin-like phospholipase family protein [Herbaspirillum sp. RTI4]MEA9983178.1 patatin-like phospholipase family protein [Herbaspirillum sp. RTI4]
MPNKIVTLALQGGGSHGAYTWGVLDRLLEDGRIDIEGVSGASAGAMNAVVMAHGYLENGRDGARAALARFWGGLGTQDTQFFTAPDFSGFGQGILPSVTSSVTPGIMDAYLTMSRFFAPTQLNPFNVNPLRDMLVAQIDFERLRQPSALKLFIAATQVSTGTLKIFRNQQLTLDSLLASACLPSVHHPITIDGEIYWDGGFTANPPIFPLLHLCGARDIMVLLLHPCRRPDNPVTAEAIVQRISEIGFSAAFFAELGGLALAKREAERGMFAFGSLERRLRNLNMHVIDANDTMSELNASSKMDVRASFLSDLFEQGRDRAELWLKEHYSRIGVRSSFDLSRYLQ